MAIVKMNHLRLFGMADEQEKLLQGLQHLGCVQVSDPGDRSDDPDWALLTRGSDTSLSQLKAEAASMKAAQDTLNRHAKEKSGALQGRPRISERELFDERTAQEAREAADAISTAEKRISAIGGEQAKLRGQKQSLTPWLELDVPLDISGTKEVSFTLGTVPNRTDGEALQQELDALTELCTLEWAGTDGEQRSLLVVCHRSVEEAVMEVLKRYSFVRSNLRGWSGTAQENITAIDVRLKELSLELEASEGGICTQSGHREALERTIDRLNQDIQREETKGKLLSSRSTFFFEGWVPAADVDKLSAFLRDYTCAWETEDPKEEEYPQVPVKLKNNILTRSMNVITEMYSLPAYDGVDPNPLMAPFFILFFGIMMADMAYGIIMVAASLFVLLKKKPKNGAFMEMIFWCGISTFLWGAVSGGFLGDFIPQLSTIISPEDPFVMPALFTPLDDLVTIMIGSLVLGMLQILTGMMVSVVKKIKDGDFLDALFDEITWWIILAGLGMMVCGMMVPGVPPVLGTVGKFAMILGGLMLALGGTRKAKGFGKVTSLVGLLYNGVTGFFSDTLSYIRLMALMVSGSVIAQVFNTLGATFGFVPLYVIISLVGNALNLALGLLGAYVHDLRLQCLEFFGRFYKEGGKPYQPLSIDTNYVDIIKEEN